MPISEKTRREIIRTIRAMKIKWNGDLDELEFLEGIYDLENLPSTDHRFGNARQDIYQHTVNNDDWLPEWIYTYEPFNMMKSSDVEFLHFLCEMINPQVRSKKAEADALLQFFNEHLGNRRIPNRRENLFIRKLFRTYRNPFIHFGSFGRNES